ncbi:MAG: GNAT family N-acetyltransferase [Eubacterium sp.]|nr:GNAT family N-acetyltransferase [Eubacterium sp.]
MKDNIIPLPKEQWKGTIIPMRYTTEEYYDVDIQKTADGYDAAIHKKKFHAPVSHYPEEYDFPDRLYQDHWEKAYAWGIVEEKDGKQELLACIETCPEEWSNRLMVTELWVHERIRRQGVAHALMAVAKEQAVLEHRRAIILETQSCNVDAIAFYQQEGFEPIGFDTCCYSNRDVERKEVRINLGYFLRRKQKVTREDIVIRTEEPCEYHQTEAMTLRAFWNKHHLGCDEHLLVHKLRQSDVYLPELSRVAAVGDEIVGVICYSKAWLKREEKEGVERVKEILLFGPLCVAPEWQGCGVGGLLLEETLVLARKAGYEGVIIFGEPDYYPRHGFRTCDHFGITTADGKNFDGFMGIELVEGGLAGFGGRFHEPEVFEDLPAAENEEFTKQFDAPVKQRFPCQWD